MMAQAGLTSIKILIMKKILTTILIALAAYTAQAQSYADSSITVTLTQRTAYWVGKYVQGSFSWKDRNLPTIMRPYIGSGTKPDSVIANVTLKAGHLFGAIDLLLSQPLLVVYDDYRSILLNQPATTGYTALATQVTNIANGNGKQKATAAWIVERYTERVSAYNALYNEGKSGVIQWSRE